MKQHLSRLLSSARENAERGAVLFLVAITALIVMVAGAIAVDLSAIATRGQDLQNAADSAALAGVQAYRQSMGERLTANGADEAAAIAAVNALLEQNGITDITPQIEFPDDENDTEVKVTLYDGDAGFLLSGFTGGGAGTVERTATARFERCEDGCLKEVAIPPPFEGIDTTGDGDGYVPIPVGDRLYSINHQSGGGGGRGNRQITCVQRDQSLCWSTPGMMAYPSNNYPDKTPEMPHAAVSGTKIYWASSTDYGHYMFCFETETPAPCSNPLRLNHNTQATNLPDRLIHRGGGTVEEDGRIFTFTDDHKVHCVIPGASMSMCPGYPKESSLGALPDGGFPDNDPDDGNHGSSIDRISDDGLNRIYSTIHIDAVAGGGDDCSNPEVPNLRNPQGEWVVLKNVSSGLYISINDGNDAIVDGTDPTDENAQWYVSTTNGYYRFQSIGAWRDGRTRYLTSPEDQGDLMFVQSNSGDRDAHFRLDDDYTSSTLRTRERVDGSYAYIREESFGNPPVIEFTVGSYSNQVADWIIREWECEAPTQTFGGLEYQPGTYLNCFDTVANAPCAGFTPSRIHDDWDSFSGRLFFHRNAAGGIDGVCSTGFTQHWDWYTNMAPYTEIACVDHFSGAENTSLENDMSAFLGELKKYTTGNANPRWGTWGDPHWNDETNRLFYPTHRTQSRVICWDFASGLCNEASSINGWSQQHGEIQDYGFFSEGNCIFGLGHNAVFWAFRADNINEKCNGSGATTSISPCNCGGNLFWGTLTFDVTIEQFEEFTVEIVDDDGNRVYPAGEETPPHSLITDGDVVDLNFIPATSENQQLWVIVNVTAKTGVDPWQDGDGSQTFTIEIGRTPHLTD